MIATVFGLTTLMTSRLIYNVSKQIQQDKVDNLLYFVDFAQAALRTKEIRGLDASKGSAQPFQTLEFLVRDWPHYADGETVSRGRDMMLAHLDQYRDPKVSADTSSMDNLARMFGNIDVWCLPHPSLKIERESWDGKLDVIEPDFWRFLDDYMRKIFSPSELAVKTTMGTPVTVGSFGAVIRKFIAAFGVAAPQAQTFAEAMETSTSLLAAESAMKVLRAQMEAALPALGDEALAPEAFEERASAAAREAQQEFEDKAIFGDEAGISRRGSALKVQVSKELDRYREENQRRLEASLGGLTNVTVAAIAAFGADRFSDVACDWWLDLCRDLSGTLSTGYLLVAAYVAFSLNNVSIQAGRPQRHRGRGGAVEVGAQAGRGAAERGQGEGGRPRLVRARARARGGSFILPPSQEIANSLASVGRVGSHGCGQSSQCLGTAFFQ
ncbi:unnamed protein product [Prorocentrum cordatum]|uniref:Guanylate-binding protein N-terminal domain-containing protein n=1 Tax=Prorocentrum cordatum TaxID=2364126 RepID=A0ABN9W9K2_9DINO|nr:unnamed protein product [Polarella glacialis]